MTGPCSLREEVTVCSSFCMGMFLSVGGRHERTRGSLATQLSLFSSPKLSHLLHFPSSDVADGWSNSLGFREKRDPF